MVVLKFGGSNLRNKADLEKILKVISMYREPFIVVVSAVNGVTNRLIDALNNIGDLDVNKFLEELYSTYQSFLSEENFELKERVYQIKEILLGTKLIGKVPDFVYDQIVSHGERCSSFLLTYYLNKNNVNCKEALPEEFGLVTDGKFKNASVDLVNSEINLKKFFKQDENY
ncbi:MAG TPA: aspartate kinase, partial [Pseudothermotoga sp.]